MRTILFSINARLFHKIAAPRSNADSGTWNKKTPISIVLVSIDRMGTKLNTPFCTRFGIDVPILVAPFGPWDEVELAVAAASAGCLASLGTAVRSVPELEHQWATLRDRTDRPFVINHTGRPFNPEAFAATLAFKPAAISFHMGVLRDLIDKAHDRGILWPPDGW